MIRKTDKGWEAVSTAGWVIGLFKSKREARAAEFNQKATEIQKKVERMKARKA